MSKDYGEFRRRSGDGDEYRSNNTYRRGITAYERPRGVKGLRNNPYSRSNMIYAKRQRRRWPIVVVVVVLLAAVVGITVFACNASNEPAAQQQGQAADAQQQGQATDTQQQEQASGDQQDTQEAGAQQENQESTAQ